MDLLVGLKVVVHLQWVACLHGWDTAEVHAVHGARTPAAALQLLRAEGGPSKGQQQGCNLSLWFLHWELLLLPSLASAP